jgi:hypothetical protein
VPLNFTEDFLVCFRYALIYLALEAPITCDLDAISNGGKYIGGQSGNLFVDVPPLSQRTVRIRSSKSCCDAPSIIVVVDVPNQLDCGA